ncbi:MAG: hypothetical protein HS113_03600 [Verrucomicrobiales bacterium]|nr:hypothetical protein [Verrucomicrobiales bacterium]
MRILNGRLLVALSATGLAMLPLGARASDAAPVAATRDRHPRAPETTRLTTEQASDALERDWLFQAMGEPLLARTAKEIGWAQELAARLRARHPALALDAEGRELEALEHRWAELSREATPTSRGGSVAVSPQWIWFPEGRPSEDAPASTRWFFRRFEAPDGVRAAEVRVATDDAGEVFLDGRRVGLHGTWQRPAIFSLTGSLSAGSHVLAVRAVNQPAPGKNPAGLIARLVMLLENGQRVEIVTDTSWQASGGEESGEQPALDGPGWTSAAVAAPLGQGPWGQIPGFGAEDVLESPVLAYAGEASAVRELHFAVRRVKRSLFFKNPALDFTRLLFIDQPLPQGPESLHEAIHRLGIMAVPGGRLVVLEGLHPGGWVRQLAPDEPGSFWRPDLSFDATKVLFCFKPAEEKSFHLYDMNLDGTGRRQLTDSEYDDIDPIYLPGGHILFTTTRGNSYVRCGPFIYSYTLARCDADGRNVYLISHNGEPDFVPALLHDGRVIYSRWEYSDKPLWRLQKLWTTGQDGTGTAHFWGNQSVWPDHLSEPRPMPGSRRVMFSGVGHHDWWSGSIGIIDPDQGRDFPHGLTKVTADLRWPEVTLPPQDTPEASDYHAAGRYTGYKTPYPVSAEEFLVSARGEGGKFRLYLMDVHGNRDLIYEGRHNVWHALPVKPRARPPAPPDRVAWPGTGKDRKRVEPGVFYSADVCQGVPGVTHDMVKFLRVFQLDYKTYSTWNKTYRHSGPAVSIVQEEGVKRILSEVPVERDGSVYFQAPAGRALFFQLLDAERRCLQTMRSFTGLMPGEVRGCTGCHEGQSVSPRPAAALALRRAPTPLSPPPWGDECISYERFAQPVLDRHCVPCHRDDPDSAEPNLVLRPGHHVFKEPYLTLVGPAGWGNPVPGGKPGYGIAGAIPVENYDPNDPQALVTLPPMQYLSRASRLIELASSGQHYQVKVPAAELHRLIAWVDACCPFLGDVELRALGDPDFPGIERLPIRPRVASAPVIERP